MRKRYIDGPDAAGEQLRVAVSRAFDAYETAELINLLSDANVVVRTKAAQHLHLRGGKPAFEAARRLARDLKPERRAIAAFVLGQLGTPQCPRWKESFAIVESQMDDHDEQVRACAILSIGALAMLERQPPKPLLAKLAEFAASPSPILRESVADAMGTIKGPVARAVLEQLAKDKHRSVRGAAKYWLDDRQD